jgi:hypothetical protein
MFNEPVTNDTILLWLKGRNKDTLRMIGNPAKLCFCIIDLSSGDNLIFKIREVKDKRIYKLYRKLQKLPIDGMAMFQDWFNNILA